MPGFNDMFLFFNIHQKPFFSGTKHGIFYVIPFCAEHQDPGAGFGEDGSGYTLAFFRMVSRPVAARFAATGQTQSRIPLISSNAAV